MLDGLFVAPENDAQQAPKRTSSGLGASKRFPEPPEKCSIKALHRSLQQPLEASRTLQAANPKPYILNPKSKIQNPKS